MDSSSFFRLGVLLLGGSSLAYAARTRDLGHFAVSPLLLGLSMYCPPSVCRVLGLAGYALSIGLVFLLLGRPRLYEAVVAPSLAAPASLGLLGVFRRCPGSILALSVGTIGSLLDSLYAHTRGGCSGACFTALYVVGPVLSLPVLYLFLGPVCGHAVAAALQASVALVDAVWRLVLGPGYVLGAAYLLDAYTASTLLSALLAATIPGGNPYMHFP